MIVKTIPAKNTNKESKYRTIKSSKNVYTAIVSQGAILCNSFMQNFSKKFKKRIAYNVSAVYDVADFSPIPAGLCGRHKC
jgi:hypothetical protein